MGTDACQSRRARSLLLARTATRAAAILFGITLPSSPALYASEPELKRSACVGGDANDAASGIVPVARRLAISQAGNGPRTWGNDAIADLLATR